MEKLRECRESSDDDSSGNSSSNSSDNELENSEDEIEHDVECIDKRAALEVDVEAMMRKMTEMSQHLKAVMRLQLEHKKGLGDGGGYREVGDPGPATLAKRAAAAQFTPPRKKHRVAVPPTPNSDDEDDLESVTSQTSSLRKKIQPPFVFVDERARPKYPEAEIADWLSTYAIAQMAKAGPHIDRSPKETDLGGMKKAHVSSVCFRTLNLWFSML